MQFRFTCCTDCFLQDGVTEDFAFSANLIENWICGVCNCSAREKCHVVLSQVRLWCFFLLPWSSWLICNSAVVELSCCCTQDNTLVAKRKLKDTQSTDHKRILDLG